MKILNYIKSLRFAFISMLLFMFIAGCGRNAMQDMIIFTQVVPCEIKIDSLTGGNWRNVGKSRIVAVDPANPGVIAEVLTEGFFAARSPEISFDGKKMLFAGKRGEGSFWEIYEMILAGKNVKQVTERKSDCTDPCYLPGNKIVFSSLNQNDSSEAGNSLYTCGPDGCCLKQITFHPHSDFATSVISDGRLVTISWQVYPVTGKSVYLSMRPDGTKTSLYYKSDNDGWLPGKAREIYNGQIVFVESESSAPDRGKLVAIQRSRPLSSKKEISGNVNGSFFSVYPGTNDNLIVSYREPQRKLFGIYEYDLSGQKLGRLLFSDNEYNSIEPVIVKPRLRPRDLPSEIIEDKTSGLVMCMNAGFSDQKARNESLVDKVQIIGLSGLISEIPVEEDGSFFIEFTADAPVRFVTVDRSGEILRGPCSWVWIRPNERRACIGCHEEPELSPENRVVDAIKKMPVTVAATKFHQTAPGSNGNAKIEK